jgi:23S rRNA (cytosine1962-C5)-methyltransferase
MAHRVRLKKRLERTLAQGHPWLFRNALAGELPAPGRVVDVVADGGRLLARGLAEAGPIGVRVWTTRDEPLDGALIARRVRHAAALRRRVLPPATDAFRLLHGEGDRLPGVVCDVYGRWAVLRLDGRAAAAWRDALLAALQPVLAELGVTGLLQRAGRRGAPASETLLGEPPDGVIEVREHGMRLPVDLERGQKTGLFLDHRETRRRAGGLARGCRVLNLFGYTGGFSIAAGLGGARAVDTVDSAAPACALAERGWAANGLDPQAHCVHPVDVRDFLRRAEAEDRRWELIVADPPSYAPSQKKVPAALDAYRALHRACIERLAPGGLYLAASCSSHVRRPAFEGTLQAAAAALGRGLQVLERSGAPADHPRLAAFPEGDYLKVVLARLLD